MAQVLNTLVAALCLFISTGCSKKDPGPEKIYRLSGRMTVDNRDRTFLLNLPPGYYEAENQLPLVIGLHGTGGSAAQFERDYMFTKQTNSSGFAVVYPEGVQSDGILRLRTWNAGTCCSYAYEQNVDDVKYIRTLIDKLVAKYKIDPRRIYVTGMSNGGMMAYRLAAEMGDKIAAIAPVSSTMVLPGTVQPQRAVPVLHIHSEKDTTVPYAGGVGLGGYTFTPVDSVLRIWAAKNSCALDPQVLVDDERYKLVEWRDCSRAAPIISYLTRDGGHSWPGGNKSNARGDEPSTVINATELICNFFLDKSLP